MLASGPAPLIPYNVSYSSARARDGTDQLTMPRVPRLPVGPDLLRRIDVPEDLDAVTTVGPEADPEALGVDAEVVERIWRAAQDLYRTGVHPALQLCVRRHGDVLIDRAIGHARGNGPEDPPGAEKVPVDTDTPFLVYSASKAVTAMVVHLLQERGALDISDRVSDYIPEYAKHGKGKTTIAHVLAHRAGVPGLPKAVLDVDRINDREFIINSICDAKPILPPGSTLAYHAASGGFILGEIVSRVTGKSIRDVLAEEILDPLSFRWGNWGVAEEDIERVGRDYVTGARLFPPLSMLVKRVLSMPVEELVELARDPRVLTAVIESANVVTTANELSRFFEIFRAGGELDGKRIMQPDTIKRALTEQSRLEIDLSLGFPTRFSYGLMLGSTLLSPYGLDTDTAFGHLGLINIMGWADPERGISCGLITSGKALLYPEVPRFYWVMQTISASLPKIPTSLRAI
jgi:CubicO group peptidase (beta-lactamase class C family)